MSKKNNQKPEKDVIEVMGEVIDSSHDNFRVILLDEEKKRTDHIILATPSGKIRMNKIRIVVGDYVNIELSPYDLNRGRITFRKGKV